MSRVGIISDTHFPFVYPTALRFAQDTFSAWRVDKIVHIGDLVDSHALGFWDHDPNGLSANDETDEALLYIEEWKKAFPRVYACWGNHDQRAWRVAKKAGIPDRYLKAPEAIFNTPMWKWGFEHKIDGVVYEHGTGISGKDGALNLATQKRRSTVIGHIHSWAGVKFHANSDNIIFGMNVGCLIDCRAYAFEYGRNFPVRPMLGCGVVIDGVPYFEPMPCGPREKYNRSRAGKRRAA